MFHQRDESGIMFSADLQRACVRIVELTLLRAVMERAEIVLKPCLVLSLHWGGLVVTQP